MADLPKKATMSELLDEKIRNVIGGKFNEKQRCYGLGQIMAKLKETSKAVIVL